MKYSLNNDFIYNDLQNKDELLFVNLNDDNDENIYKLKGVAREIFLSLLDNLSHEEIVQKILSTYEINDQEIVLKNIKTLVSDLRESKILITE